MLAKTLIRHIALYLRNFVGKIDPQVVGGGRLTEEGVTRRIWSQKVRRNKKPSQSFASSQQILQKQ